MRVAIAFATLQASVICTNLNALDAPAQIQAIPVSATFDANKMARARDRQLRPLPVEI